VAIRIKKFSPYLLVCFLAVAVFIFLPNSYSKVKSFTLNILSLPLKIVQFPLQELKKVFSYRSTYQENSRLKNQADGLRRRLINQEEIIQENERLKKLLSFKGKSGFSLIAARVIAKDPSNWDSVVIIDKGSNDGVRVNLAAITELGLAGQVIEVDRNQSKVMLINDPSFNVASLVQRTREEGIVSGTITGICRMKYLSLNSDVKSGDAVMTSGLSQEFPKGLLIGSVTEAEEDSSGLSKNCLIKPAVNLSKLEELLLIIP
jgi:rod shape-determining protein MreC